MKIRAIVVVMLLSCLMLPGAVQSSPIPNPSQPQSKWKNTLNAATALFPQYLLRHDCVSKTVTRESWRGLTTKVVTCDAGAWCVTPAEVASVKYAHCVVPDSAESTCTGDASFQTVATFGQKSLIVADGKCAAGETCVLGQCTVAGIKICKDYDATNVSALQAMLADPKQLAKNLSVKTPSHVEVTISGGSFAYTTRDFCVGGILLEAACKKIDAVGGEEMKIQVPCNSIPGATCAAGPIDAQGNSDDFCNIPDADSDGVADSYDNCPNNPNPQQMPSESCLGADYADIAKTCDPDGDGYIDDQFTDPLLRHLVWMNVFYKSKGQILPPEVNDSPEKNQPISLFQALQLTSLEDFSTKKSGYDIVVNYPLAYGNYYADLTNLNGLQCLSHLESLTLARAHQIDPAQLATLANLPKLKQLTLSGGFAAGFNFDGLKSVPALEELTIRYIPITSLAGINNLKALKKLTLTKAELDDAKLQALTDLPNLEFMDLSGNKLTQTTFLQGVPHVKELYLHKNAALKNISWVKGLFSLQKLCTDYTAVASLDALKDLTQLTHLWSAQQYGCGPSAGLCLTDLTPLAGKKLVELDLTNNDIAYLAPLGSAVTTVQKLYLDNNYNLKDVSPLEKATQLQVLSLLHDCYITDIAPLIANPGIGEDDLVNLCFAGIPPAQLAALKSKTLVTNNGTDYRLCGQSVSSW